MGASVPTTNAGPVVVLEVVLTMDPVEQPVATITAADSRKIASLKGVILVWRDISITSLSAGHAQLMKDER
jgi:hypothetical protein